MFSRILSYTCFVSKKEMLKEHKKDSEDKNYGTLGYI